MSEACGASVPEWMKNKFDGLDEDLESRRALAIEIAIDQCRDLINSGFENLHFYTLNQATVTKAVCNALSLEKVVVTHELGSRKRIAELPRLTEKRILTLDGAMGTMIQRHKPDEAMYRGSRFSQFNMDLQGNNDLLSLTQPDIYGRFMRCISTRVPTLLKQILFLLPELRKLTTRWKTTPTK